MGLHTLVLVDIKVREQSEENMARCVLRPSSPGSPSCPGNADSLAPLALLVSSGKLIYEPPRFMNPAQAIEQMISTEEDRAEGASASPSQPALHLFTPSQSLTVRLPSCSPPRRPQPGRDAPDHALAPGHADPVDPVRHARPARRADRGRLWRAAPLARHRRQARAPARGRVRRRVRRRLGGEGQEGRVLARRAGRAQGRARGRRVVGRRV